MSSWHPKLKELLKCSLCAGFWVTIGLFARLSAIEMLAISGLGFIIYELQEKYLPCEACKLKENNTGFTFK